MRIMISHEHREHELATAWHELLMQLGGTAILPWYSSDSSPEGGMEPGRWLEIVHDRLQKSDYVVAILTQESMNRPWILWECGMAMGQAQTRAVIPILYGVKMSDFSGPMSHLQGYKGDRTDSVKSLCLWLGQKANIHLDETRVNQLVVEYMEKIEKYFEVDEMSTLFGFGFHRPDKSLEGRWQVTWYMENGDVFEDDTFDLYMYPNKLRIIGHGIDGTKGYSYPMEGKINAERYIVMHYWSQPQITVGGTVMMRVSPDGKTMKGQWTGNTTQSFEDDDLRLVSGRLKCKKIT